MQRPWNIINSPVYSLATFNDGIVNMNICTYVTAISMNPKLYAIAVYNNTKSLENILKSEYCALQVLHANQIKLVNVLGKKSGINYNKQQYLQKKGLLMNWNNHLVLNNTAALIQLQKINYQQTGDHVLFTFKVMQYKTFSADVLTTKMLSESKMIRI